MTDDYMQRLLRDAPEGFAAGVDAAIDGLIHDHTSRLADSSPDGSPIGDPEWANYAILYLVGLAAARLLEEALGKRPRRPAAPSRGAWARARSWLGMGRGGDAGQGETAASAAPAREPSARGRDGEPDLPSLLRGAPEGFAASVDAAVARLVRDQSERLATESPSGSPLANPKRADLAALYLVGQAAQERLHRTEGSALRRMVHDALTPEQRTALLRMVAANPEREDAIYMALGEEIIRKGAQRRG